MSDDTSLLAAVVLGVVQGITEFLPVSSSGHLVVLQQFLEVHGDDVLFDLVLHLGTLLPAVWFYRADVQRILADAWAGDGPFWRRPGVRLGALVAVATVPTGLVGLALKDLFEAVFHTPVAVAGAFAFTGVLLWSTRGRDGGERGLTEVGWPTALALGLAQAVAITPGVSRSGTTIAVALLLGVERELAVKLSFLMSVPVIAGAALLQARHASAAELEVVPLSVGFLAAAIVGYAALAWLVRLVRRGRFSAFAWYLWLAAAVTLALVASGAA